MTKQEGISLQRKAIFAQVILFGVCLIGFLNIKIPDFFYSSIFLVILVANFLIIYAVIASRVSVDFSQFNFSNSYVEHKSTISLLAALTIPALFLLLALRGLGII